MTVIPALKKPRQEDPEFRASMDYIQYPSLKKKEEKDKKKKKNNINKKTLIQCL